MDTESLGQQRSSINISGDSHFYVGACSPVSLRDVCILQGDFMPQDPFMFYVAHGRFNKPWLYLHAFHLCVTLGPLLHHEKNFSFFKARTMVCDDGQWVSPLLTLIIPHSLGLPIWFPPVFQELLQFSDRAELQDLGLPDVAIDPRGVRVWCNVVELGPLTRTQAAVASRLEQSRARLDKGGVKEDC